jgi:glycosyltransferase involved in cell wall biosynthesis
MPKWILFSKEKGKLMISVIVPFFTEPREQLDRAEIEIKKAIPDCEVLLTYGGRGKGCALKEGSMQAQGEYIAWLDADLQISPIRLNSFLKVMEIYDAEAVIGNKRNDYSVIHYSFLRHVISNGYNFLIRILFGISLRDTQCGIKLFRADTLKSILPKVESCGFAFDLEVLCLLRDNKHIVMDSPIVVNMKIGAGSATAGNILNTLRETLKVWNNHRKGNYILKKE